MYILVLESSTTSAKAMLYDTKNDSYEVRTKAYTLLNDDVTIQDAETVFMETVDLGRMLCEGKKIDIISLSGTWHSLMLCDKDMQPKTPVYLWSYTGAANICKELRKDKLYVNEFYQKTGCMVNAIYPVFKLKLLREKGYCLDRYLISGQGTYNMFRLTSKRVVTDSMASGSGLLNIHTKEFDKEILKDLELGESQLGQLITYEDTFPLSKQGAELLGIEEGIPVISTCPDGGLNQVGAGALNDGIMTFSIGTSGAIRLATPKPILPDEPSIWCYFSPKTWLSGAATSGCCNCVDWFKDRMFSPDTSYDDIEKGFGNLRNTPIFLPFLFGERCPGWHDERTASFYDLSPSHTANDLYHGVLEGVLFNLYQCYEILSKINGIPETIKLSGGILNSTYWTQMCADIFGKDMKIDDTKHSSLLGGAVLGMELLGKIQDAREFKTDGTKVIHPNPKNSDIYAEKYAHYKYWYERTI